MKDKLRELAEWMREAYRAGFIAACKWPAPVTQDVDSSAYNKEFNDWSFSVREKHAAILDAEGDGVAVAWQDKVNEIANNIGESLNAGCNQDAVDRINVYVDELFALTTHPARSGVVSDALGALYYSLPDVLPASANERFTKTGKWLDDMGWEMKGFTGRLEYRSDDMVSVYAAMDQARATLEHYERNRK